MASSSSSKRQFDVFVSFRGKDTRNTFTAYLLESLRRKGIDAFFDGKLLRGKNISELFDRIEQSKMSIVVFSERYANSTWCLDELLKIIQCREPFDHQVLPIFYKVRKSDVENQTGTFGAPFLSPEESFKEDCHKVEPWKEALKIASNIVGHVLPENRPEIEFVEEIAQETFGMLRKLLSCEIRGFPGIESRSKELEELLMFDDANCIRIIGVFGIAKIGKTAVVASVYKRNHGTFDGHCFLEDIENESKRHGLHHLHQDLLCELLGEKKVNVRAHGRLENFLRNKKLLIVLDNVTEESQIHELIGELESYRNGSRIVVTTRDESLLSRNFDATYVVPRLNNSEAMELFCLKAFSDKPLYPPEEFVDLSNNFVYYARGQPLELKLLGSDLHQKKKTYWMEKWESLRVTSDKEIQEVLTTGVEPLDDEHQRMYLDITCLLKSAKADGVNAGAVMRDLEDKCLVTFTYNQHDQNIQKRTSTMSFQLQPILQNSNHIILRPKSPMAVSSSVVSSVPHHQVFLSFRAKLRHKFIYRLVKALRDKHISVYIDNNLQKGEPHINFRQIDKSRIALAIFSEGYTESLWCLTELLRIKKRMEEGKLVVIPIFYKMEPNTVLHILGAFGDMLRDQTQRVPYYQANKWEQALKSVGERIGFIYNINRNESRFIDQIVQEILLLLPRIAFDETLDK